MKLHHLTVEEAFASLRSRTEGLTTDEAARRLTEYGPNAVDQLHRRSLTLRFLGGFTHFFALILWAAAILAWIAEFQHPGEGMALLGGAIVGVIVINGVFSFWQEYRAERSLDALQKLLPHQVSVRRSGETRSVSATNLVPGDVIVLTAGDRVPADCRLVEGFGARVNNATITGEALPHSLDAAVSDESDFMRSSNVLLAGTTLVSGEATALVFATGPHTVFGQIAHLTQAPKASLSPLQKEIVRLSRLVAGLATGMGIIFFLIGHAIGLSFWGNFVFAIGIIVANVPEGLLPTLTLALAKGSQRMARRQALIRHLPAVETLGAATVICTDKTGTLTENRLTAKRLWMGGHFTDVRPAAPLQSPTAAHPRFFEIAAHCHDLKSTNRSQSGGTIGDPLELALTELAAACAPNQPEWPRLEEIPFDSKRRRMATLHSTPDGSRLFVKGAPESVLPCCLWLDLVGGPAPLNRERRIQLECAETAMAAEGLRVLALAWRPVPEGTPTSRLESDLILAGLVGLEDPPRPEVPAAIRKCREAGVRVIMVTGDHPHTAEAIARETGIITTDRPMVFTGDQLLRLSNTQLQLALDAPGILFARVSADQKTRIVNALKRKGETVAVTGDGVNDAPALRQADIGIAMGRGGTDVAREAADMILLDDNFATIVAAIEEGRAVYANIRKFLTYILTSNIPEIVPYLAFTMFRIPLPLTIIQILAVDLGTDLLPALALGAEPPRPQLMQQPPRPRAERLLNFALMARAYLWLGPMQAAAAMAAYWFVLSRGGWKYGQSLPPGDPLYLQATTACLSAIIVMQVVNVFLCRSRYESALASGWWRNPLIFWGLVVEIALILLIDYTPWGNAIFGTAPLPPVVWLLLLPCAGAMLLLEEIRKWIVRRIHPTACPTPEGAPGSL